jgi:hypothetical protein
MEHGLPVLLHCAEQLHVQMPPDACCIEIESTPSAVGTLVGVAVDGVAVDGAAVRVGLPHALKPHIPSPGDGLISQRRTTAWAMGSQNTCRIRSPSRRSRAGTD